MSCVMTKSVFGVSDQAQHKLGCANKEDGQRFEISDLGIHNKGIVLFM